VSELLLQQALPGSRLVVAIDPGNAQHRVWFGTGDGGPWRSRVRFGALRPGSDEVSGLVCGLAGEVALTPTQARVALARHSCRSTAQPSLPPARSGPLTANAKARLTAATNQPADHAGRPP
jgi:hypothetical protein